MNGLFLSLGALLGVGLVFYILNRKIDRRLETSALVERIQHEVDEILIELNGSTERNIGLIEARIKALSALVDQADRKIGVLRGELEKQARSADTYSDVVKQRRAAAREHAPRVADIHDGELKGDQPLPANDGPTIVQPASSAPRLRDRVRTLYGEGYAAQEIAQKLGSPIGEVELILSLLDREGIRRQSAEDQQDRE